MNIKVCDKCKATNIETLIPKLENLDTEKEIEVGCFRFCGIGFSRAVALVDNIPVIAEDEDKLIEEIKKKKG